MTAPARIPQSDIERATKAVLKIGCERARIILDLKNERIEIIIGESGGLPVLPEPDEWDDDDV